MVKQNSLVSSGVKVFRWSLETMQFEDKFYNEIKFFLGDYIEKIKKKTIKIDRDFKLYHHQKVTLKTLKNARTEGKKAFLIVFPTGTGKTRIVINDYFALQEEQQDIKLLFLVPTRALTQQTITVFKKEIKKRGLQISINNNFNSQITIETYSGMSNRYRMYSKDYFDYIAVDEAHHAVAPTIGKILSYFNPKYLVGVTATPERLDGKKIEKIFGEYSSELTLEDAILTNVLVPIRAFRIKTNIDLSEVRYNGKDYVSSDLQKKIFLPSRDQIVIDTLKEHLVNEKEPTRSGVIFCVSIKHAVNFAKRLNSNGINARAVSSKDKNSNKYIKEYSEGKVQFLTTASLLTEGWDSPRTSIIVMARPTMSKVLYLQQIGRGTRKYPGKDALYILDVVDNYGPLNAPWSIHAIFGIAKYIPYANILETKNLPDEDEIHELDGLTEKIISYERINIGTFENEYPNHMSSEQLARELFVSTGTIKSWIKKKRLLPDVVVPFGSKKLYYFDKNNLKIIRDKFNIGIHDENTIYDDFWEFMDQRTYTLSYKMIFLLSFMKVVDSHGEANLDDVTIKYIWFYKLLHDHNLKVDKDTSPYTKMDILNDTKYIQRSLLSNPFEKYERKRFFFHSKDLKRISISPYLLSKLQKENYIGRIQKQMFEDLISYYNNLGVILPIDQIKNYYS